MRSNRQVAFKIVGRPCNEVSGSLETLTRLAQTPVRKDANGAIVELGDIATIQRGTPNPPPAKAIIADLPGIVVGAQVRDESRIDWWNKEATKVLEEFRKDLPEGVELDVIFNQMPYVEYRFSQLLSNFPAWWFCGLLNHACIPGMAQRDHHERYHAFNMLAGAGHVDVHGDSTPPNVHIRTCNRDGAAYR